MLLVDKSVRACMAAPSAWSMNWTLKLFQQSEMGWDWTGEAVISSCSFF